MEDFLDNSIKYLSGEYSPEEKETFLKEVGDSKKNSEEFGALQSVDTILKNTAKSFVPAEHSKRAIFESLGYATIQPVIIAKPFYLSRFFIAISSSILTALATLYIANFLNTKEVPTNFENTNILRTANENANTKISNQAPSKIKRLKNSSAKSNATKAQFAYSKRETSKAQAAQKPLNQPEQKYSSSESADITENRIADNKSFTQLSQTNNFRQENLMDNRRNIGGMNRGANSFRINIPENFENSERDKLFAVELNFALSYGVQKSTINPNKYSSFNNMGIAATYKIDDNIKLGLELRQETFFLKYYSIDSGSRLFLYEQNPNFTSICGNMKYYFVKFKDMNSFAKIDLGGNSYGALIRGGIGGDFNIGDNMTLCAEGQYSSLFYKHQSKNYSSQKYSFTIGLGYQF